MTRDERVAAAVERLVNGESCLAGDNDLLLSTFMENKQLVEAAGLAVLDESKRKRVRRRRGGIDIANMGPVRVVSASQMRREQRRLCGPPGWMPCGGGRVKYVDSDW